MNRRDEPTELRPSSGPGDGAGRYQATHRSSQRNEDPYQRTSFPVIVCDEGNAFVTYVPALDFSSAFGPTRAEALARTRQLIVGYLQAAAIEGIELPPPSRLVELVDLSVVE